MAKKSIEDIDKKKINELVILSKRFVFIAYFLLIILGIYAITILLKEWKIMIFLKSIFTIISPLFIGLIIAWLFDPAVRYFTKKGIKRGWATAIVYIILITIISVILGMIVPLLSEQINDFAATIPQVFDRIKVWIDGIFNNLKNIQGFDAEGVKTDLFKNIENYGDELTSSLPTLVVNGLKSLFSGLGIILVGLVIGFYILISFDNTDDMLEFLPKKFQKDTRNVVDSINLSLRRFVSGTFALSTLVFITSALGFWIAGLKAPLLFGIFCGLTNIIPFAGPYIGGAPAIIVGFSQNPTVGFITLIVIVVIQFFEGNFFQPIVMSKTMKMHPVTIMLGLLIFGYYWGIVGMIVSTPIIASLKAIFVYFDEKYDLLKFN